MAIIGETSEQKREREIINDELRRKSERIAESSGEPRQYIDPFTSTQPLELFYLPDGRMALRLIR